MRCFFWEGVYFGRDMGRSCILMYLVGPNCNGSDVCLHFLSHLHALKRTDFDARSTRWPSLRSFPWFRGVSKKILFRLHAFPGVHRSLKNPGNGLSCGTYLVVCPTAAMLTKEQLNGTGATGCTPWVFGTIFLWTPCWMDLFCGGCLPLGQKKA